MCGIAGYVGSLPFPSDYFYRALADRGPNDRGEWSAPLGDGRFVHLLHTRLSILDLSSNSSQPMIDPSSGSVLVYNGEIFNYRSLRRDLDGESSFRTTGDTEVLLRGLARRGPGFLEELDGMFALLWFDPARRRLVMARDPLGIKPLYYTRTTDGGWLFASQVRAIVHSGLWAGGIDEAGVEEFLRFGALPDPITIFRGISAFPAGFLGEINLDAPSELHRHNFWPIERLVREEPPSDFLDWHDEVWRQTIAEHLQSDVPTGVFLSAGLDSTAILEAVPSSQRGSITAFTLAGDLTTDDESSLAAETAANLRIAHQAVRLGTDEVGCWVDDGLAAMDLPSADGINTYLVSRASRSAGLTVALSGAGADELHGAYGRAHALSRIAQIAHFAGPAAALFRGSAQAACRLAGRENTAERLGLLLEQATEPWRMARERRRYFTPNQIAGIWPGSRTYAERWNPPSALGEDFEDLDEFNKVTLAELRCYLRDMLLRDSDWATMANSQELRVPFLGRKYVECVMRLPAAWRRRRGGTSKPLLARTISPANRVLLGRRKTGFNLARARLLLGRPFRNQFHASAEILKERLDFSIDSSAALAQLEANPSPRDAFRLWALLSLGVYLGRHS